jgi:membrane protein required for colicin V production
MNWVDLAVLAVLCFSALLGVLRGLVREVLGLGAWIGAVLAGVYGFSAVQPFFRRQIANPDIADPVAFGVLFLATLIVLSLAARAVGMAVRGSALGGLDRTLGLLFGLARGALLLVVAYIVGGMVVPMENWPPVVQQARALPAVYRAAAWAAGQMPPGYRPRTYPPPSGGISAAALLHATPQGRVIGPPHPGR